MKNLINYGYIFFKKPFFQNSVIQCTYFIVVGFHPFLSLFLIKKKKVNSLNAFVQTFRLRGPPQKNFCKTVPPLPVAACFITSQEVTKIAVACDWPPTHSRMR